MENRKHQTSVKNTLIHSNPGSTEKNLLRIVIRDLLTSESNNNNNNNDAHSNHNRHVHFSPDSDPDPEALNSGSTSDKRQNHHHQNKDKDADETEDHPGVNCTSLPSSPRHPPSSSSSSSQSRSPRASKNQNQCPSRTNDKNPSGEKIFDFRIIENCGSGNCLFYTIDEFLHSHGRHCPHGDFISNEEELRREIVSFIVKPGKPVKSSKSSQSSKNYSNWERFRREIKLNLEDHMPFFRHYDPDCADEEQEETARQVYKHYMNQTGTYGTCAELYAAMEMYSFGATIIAKDSRACDKYVVYHLDMNSSGAKYIRKPRIYIHFQGSPAQGHFELLDPITVFRPYHPCPLPSGQYKVRERNYRDRYFRLIPAKSAFKSNDGDWTSFWRALQSWKRENNPAYRKRKHDESLNDENKEEEENLPNCNKNENNSVESCKKVKCGKSQDPIPDPDPNSTDSSDPDFSSINNNDSKNTVPDDEDEDGSKKNNNEDSVEPVSHSKSKSDSIVKDSDCDSDCFSNSNEKPESVPESDSPDFLMVDFETYPKIEAKEPYFENDAGDNENENENDNNNYNLRLRILTLPFSQQKHKSEENVLLSEAEMEGFYGRYSLQLARMQEDLLRGVGKATAWKGIKVSKVFELNNFYTSFIQMEPGAIKPLSKTNHQTHFIIYDKDSIFITVFDSEEEMQAKSANIDESFSLNPGRLYTLQNTMDHPVLIRIWWMLEVSTDEKISKSSKK